MKRTVIAAMIAAMALGVFTGCGTSGGASGGTSGGTQSQNTASQTTDQGNNTTGNTADGNTSNGNTSNGNGAQSQTPAVSQEDAVKTALGKVPGATENDIRIELDWDDGRQKYEGEIRYDQKEYDFEIDANTGEVIEWSEERADY